MGRHKKRLREDKAKVKLKQSKTKFLPKGLNVTKTDFKIKPIVLLEQLKEKDVGVPLSKRKLDAKELLNRVKHYNELVRYNACEELAEMIKIHYSELIDKWLSHIVLSISSLMQDRERKVRKSAAKVISTILQILKSDSSVDRTLTLNLGSKVTTVTWRLKVLTRLHAVLETIIRNHNIEDEVKKGEVFVDAESCRFIPLYKTSFSKALENSAIVFDSKKNTSLEANVLNRHIITLVPLLYEIWMEILPEKNIGKAVTEYTFLKEGAAAVLYCIMKTLYLLWKYVNSIESNVTSVRSVFLSNEGKKFMSHLLTNFPYCQAETKGSKKPSETSSLLESNPDPKCVAENLLICYMYCVLNLHHVPVKLKIEMEAITAYVNKCLLTKKYVNQNSMRYLILFLRTCLIENTLSWKRAGSDLKSILENTVTFYHYNIPNETCRLEVFDILASVVDISFLKNLQCYQNWLSSVPNLLCGSKVTDVLVKAMLNLSRKNINVFYKALQKMLPKILENLESLQIVVTDKHVANNEEVVKRNIVNIFYFVPCLDTALISNYILEHQQSTYGCYFKKMLSLRKRTF
ncbi:hypothetical protein NQ315_013655 [Exocentrus adspersus]|uniref:Uncharacterized protein n=1 Tax=Exocentrus adspersus TaxID=1586481 RepID=A0AAV8W418_9CUCU|nr:hypothetical protein NQ315_013655 [Exocentrus adspersus]